MEEVLFCLSDDRTTSSKALEALILSGPLFHRTRSSSLISPSEKICCAPWPWCMSQSETVTQQEHIDDAKTHGDEHIIWVIKAVRLMVWSDARFMQKETHGWAQRPLRSIQPFAVAI